MKPKQLIEAWAARHRLCNRLSNTVISALDFLVPEGLPIDEAKLLPAPSTNRHKEKT